MRRRTDPLFALICAIADGRTDVARRSLRADPALARAASEVGAERAAERPFFLATIGHYIFQGDTALHAADTNHWNPTAQRKTIEFLIDAGANPNALDKSGVGPLHRAVRTRSSDAVCALLAGGADPALENGRGSSPLDLAMRTTGRGGSGTVHARREQARIVDALIAECARRKHE